jgi:hypothetical protein
MFWQTINNVMTTGAKANAIKVIAAMISSITRKFSRVILI